MKRKISLAELAELEAQLLASPQFKKAPARRDLLKYFVAHWGQFCTAEEIWVKAFRNHPSIFNDTNVRERCMDLRKTLEDIFRGVRKGWVLELPPATPRDGYRLEVERVEGKATHAFWQPYTAGKWTTTAVYDELTLDSTHAVRSEVTRKEVSKNE